MPTLTAIAGPNGSGISTLTSSIWFKSNENLIDPEAIAGRIEIGNLASMAMAAAQEASWSWCARPKPPKIAASKSQ